MLGALTSGFGRAHNHLAPALSVSRENKIELQRRDAGTGCITGTLPPWLLKGG